MSSLSRDRPINRSYKAAMFISYIVTFEWVTLIEPLY